MLTLFWGIEKQEGLFGRRKFSPMPDICLYCKNAAGWHIINPGLGEFIDESRYTWIMPENGKI